MAEAYSLSFHTVGAKNPGDDQVETGYQVQKTIMIISIPICALGLLGNGIVLWLLWSRIHRTRFTVYFLNMAVADLTVLLYYVTVFILFLKAVPISMLSLHIIELTHAVGFNTSTYILTAISTERFLMIFCPALCLHKRHKHLSQIICAVMWGLSCLMSLMLYITCYTEFDPLFNEGTSICEPTKMFRVIVNIFLFLPIMVFSTVVLLIRMLRKMHDIPPAKLDISIVATALLFVLFAASARIIEIIARGVPNIHIPVIFLIFHFLDAIDSSGKPFIYLIVGYTEKQMDEDCYLQMFLERALLDEGDVAEGITWAPGTK